MTILVMVKKKWRRLELIQQCYDVALPLMFSQCQILDRLRRRILLLH